jgi:hypothetical protein
VKNKVLEIEGKKMWGLLVAARDKRQRYQCDQDYIEALVIQMNGLNEAKAKEAKEALIFLNAFIYAEIDNNFNWLKEIGIHPSEVFKKEIYNSTNAAKRDLLANNQGAIDELTDVIGEEAATIGELVDGMRAYKKSLKRQGKSIADTRRKKINSKFTRL